MIRLLLPIMFSYLVLVGRFFDDGVKIDINLADSVKAGESFLVDVVIKKTAISGFSRFSMDLPAGLTATPNENSNGDFSFENNRVRIIWLNIAPDEEVRISFYVQVTEFLKGKFELTGNFSYIKDNERQSVANNTPSVQIIPSPFVDPSSIVDIGDYGKPVEIANQTDIDFIGAQKIGNFSGNVLCIRQQPEAGTSEMGGLRVNILVHKGSMNKYAKIEEKIPAGYKAIPIETETGMFTFKDQVAKFLWLKLPDKNDFIVSYLLIPDGEAQGTEEALPDGELSYMVNEKTYISQVMNRPENLRELDKTSIQNLIAQLLGQKITPTASSEVSSKKRVSIKKRDSFRSYMLEPESGIYYRVQVAAGHNPINIRIYFRRLKIREEVRTEKHEGWYKYSIGSFPEYKVARDTRVNIWNNTNVKDAFIAAYNNGKRITVQEALMVTNQKWLR